MRHDRDRSLAEVDLLRETPVLDGWVDRRQLHRVVEGWPWGSVAGPSRPEFTAVLRVLALAGFLRAARGRLRETAVYGDRSGPAAGWG